ncbi:MAG TPA: hypothetical protein VHB30_04600 [Solirubrobacteraceae bacterium]|nr:hypothetical protein [Solirubrobacteraceae bacterium]
MARPSEPSPRRRAPIDDGFHRGLTPRATVAIRLAGGRDADAVTALEQMEGRRLAPGAHLVAEVDGRVIAAVAVADGGAVSDPFAHAAAAVDLLRLRAGQLRDAGVSSGGPLRRAARLAIVR